MVAAASLLEIELEGRGQQSFIPMRFMVSAVLVTGGAGYIGKRSPDTGGFGASPTPRPQGAWWAMGIAHRGKPRLQFARRLGASGLTPK